MMNRFRKQIGKIEIDNTVVMALSFYSQLGSCFTLIPHRPIESDLFKDSFGENNG